MRFYLSSYKLGKEAEKIKQLMPEHNRRIGYIPNAMDFSGADPERREKGIQADIGDLRTLGLDVELLDLKRYFGRQEELQQKLEELGGVWVRGGNTFVLRQAMKLSGFDALMSNLQKRDFLYGGYSAGVCVLAPDLHSLQIVDNPAEFPYEGNKEIIWEGLSILEYMILPHYQSDHPESADIDKEIAYCRQNNIPFKPLRDGEAIIIE